MARKRTTSGSRSPRDAKRRKGTSLSPQPKTIPTSSPIKDEALKVQKEVRYVKTPVYDGQDGYFFMAPEDYTNFSYLAKGAFGVVASADYKGMRVVVKKIHCKSLVFMESALRELHNLSYFSMRKSVGVVRLKDCWLCDDEFLYLALEKFEKSLDMTLGSRETRLKAGQWRRVAGMLVAALNGLHSCGAMHRDLKPDNVVVNADCTKLALIDLGTVRCIEAKKQQRPLTPVRDVTTEGYRAPEVGGGDTKYCQQIDMFAAGCLLAHLKLGEELFPRDDDLEKFKEMTPQAVNKFLKKKFTGLAKADTALLLNLLDRNPSTRPSSADLIRQIMSPEEESDIHHTESDAYASDDSAATVPSAPIPYSEPTYTDTSSENMLLKIKRLIADFQEYRRNCS
eukprot:TRINITY_DN22521_c0_g1_i1.p1 TRINITY_DN22521_c0_g1~~TRINITY_DN22521_c0_g1_i1.p1  ORF type:complete len:396 (+),score=114.62 TRINITY_DN22521_c0_g1_i1:177-1364(+)